MALQAPQTNNPQTVPARQTDLTMEQIYEGVADYATTFQLINRYSQSNPYHGLGFRAGQWFETNERIYWQFLKVLPPLHMTSGGFVMSECTMGNLYESFMELDGRYFCAVVDWNGSQSFADLWTALLAVLIDR